MISVSLTRIALQTSEKAEESHDLGKSGVVLSDEEDQTTLQGML
ncbi:hypothetical protein RU98_GL001309 [Enterococcus caccae]|nr:hypothetical protein RU98_GL001309 [Enterococcus caccae]